MSKFSRRYRFAPTVNDLESRQMLSTLTATSVPGVTVTIDSPGIVSDPSRTPPWWETWNTPGLTSVGSPFTINVTGGNNSSFNYYFYDVPPNGAFQTAYSGVINADPQKTSNDLSPTSTFTTFKYADLPTYVPNMGASFKGYFDAHAGDTESIAVYSGTHMLGAFSIIKQAPQAIIDMQFLGETPGYLWGFQPLNVLDNVARNFAPWGDPTVNRLGLSSPGGGNGEAMTFNFAGKNTTPSKGVFTDLQFVQMTTSVDVGQFQKDNYLNPTWFLPFRSTYSTPGYGTSYAEWGSDVNTANNQIFVPCDPGQAVATPPFTENYTDNPSVLIQVTKGATYFPYHIDYTANLMTNIVWVPEGGIPIVVAQQPWSVTGSYDNQQARDLMNPNSLVASVDLNNLWNVAYATQSTWTPTNGGMRHGQAINSLGMTGFAAMLPTTSTNTPADLLANDARGFQISRWRF